MIRKATMIKLLDTETELGYRLLAAQLYDAREYAWFLFQHEQDTDKAAKLLDLFNDIASCSEKLRSVRK